MGLTVPQAAELLHWNSAHHLRLLAGSWGRTQSVWPKTVKQLAKALSAVDANGWSRETWERELMAARPKGNNDKLAEAWPRELVAGITSNDPLVLALKDRIVQGAISRQQASEIAGVSARSVSNWLGMSSGKSRKPWIHQIANVAHLLDGPGLNALALENSMRRVFRLLEEHEPSSAGLLILRKLSELGLTVPGLSRMAPRDAETLYRYIKHGTATVGTREAVTNGLALSSEECVELVRRTLDPAPRDEEKRRKTLKRNWNLKRGQPLGTRQAAQNRTARSQAQMREAWEDLIQNGRVPTQTILVKEYGFKRETVKKWRAGTSP